MNTWLQLLVMAQTRKWHELVRRGLVVENRLCSKFRIFHQTMGERSHLVAVSRIVTFQVWRFWDRKSTLVTDMDIHNSILTGATFYISFMITGWGWTGWWGRRMVKIWILSNIFLDSSISWKDLNPSFVHMDAMKSCMRRWPTTKLNLWVVMLEQSYRISIDWQHIDR